jgi:hypothetical protein
MALANNLHFYDTAIITAIKRFKVQAPEGACIIKLLRHN